MSLAPYFVLWAGGFFSIVLICGGIAWLVVPGPLARLLRTLWLADAVAAWLAYAAAYHLVFLDAWRLVLQPPYAVWGLCALLGLYLLLRRSPTPLRRPEALFALAVLTWALVLAAGFRYVEDTAADAAALRERPAAVLDAREPIPGPLRRALLLSRLDPDLRGETVAVLRTLAGPPGQADTALLSRYRLQDVPRLLEHYRRDLAKLRTYQWVQVGLLGAVLLLWGFGRAPAAPPA